MSNVDCCIALLKKDQETALKGVKMYDKFLWSPDDSKVDGKMYVEN